MRFLRFPLLLPVLLGAPPGAGTGMRAEGSPDEAPLQVATPSRGRPGNPGNPGEPAREPTRWGLVIGISDYIHFEDTDGGDLPGAEGDARMMRDVLVGRRGFPEENVRLLLNGDATRDAIEAGIREWLGGRVQEGDNVVIYFAGHGSQVWDEDGDEDDGLDETIAPADVLPDRPDFDITDDTFGGWLAEIPSSNVVVILDNCNSGTGTRDLTPFARTRKLARDPNRLPAPPAAQRRSVGAAPADASGFDAGGRRVLEIAAAQPDQVALDAWFPGEAGGEGFHGGAFTTHLVRQLWQAPADATYEEIFERVRAAMERNRFQQVPLLSTDVPLKDAPVFSVAGAAPAGRDLSVRVTGTEGNLLVLDAGAALGLTPGSILEGAGGARVRIEGVGRASATGRAIAGAPGVGTDLRLAAYRFARSELRVGVSGLGSDWTSALSASLGGGEAIVLVEEPDAFAHLLIRRRGDELRVVGADGEIRASGFPADAGGIPAVASQLRKEAAARELAELENPRAPFAVHVRMGSGGDRFGIGENLTFEVTSGRDGYLTLVDLGTDGTVTQLFPNAWQPATRIEAGRPLVFPTAEMDFELQVLPPAGWGMVRAFVTPTPLELPDAEDFAQGDERLAAAIVSAVLEAAGTIEEAARLDGWATVALPYRILP